jgi:hypothetical protein
LHTLEELANTYEERAKPSPQQDRRGSGDD